jgi:ribosome-binding protein aMBF1 (putative translation factor)
MTSLATLRDQILSDPEAQAEYERLGPIYAVVGEMVDARQSAGLTQAELARRMGTSQSVIARLESARHMPTFDLISRYAQALGQRVEVRLAPLGS